MGEIAEMMLDGTLCQTCGGVIDGTTPGYPRYCEDCAKDQVEHDIKEIEYEEIEYDFNFNYIGIEQLALQVKDRGSMKQKKAIIKLCYKLIDKLNKSGCRIKGE
jgi:hypothetical protein